MEKYVDLKISLKVDATNEKTTVETMSIEQKDGERSYKQKVLSYLKLQLKRRKDRMESFQSPMGQTNEHIIVEKMRVEDRYHDLENLISQIEMID